MVFDGAYFLELFPAILPGLKNTLSITALSYAGGLVIGLLLAFVYRRRIPLLYSLAQVYVSFFRGAPVVALLFLIYFGMPRVVPPLGSLLNAYWATVITIALNISAYMSESIRAAIDAVDRGQIEAGLAEGMTNGQVFRYIVLPQAGKIALPSLSNNLVITLKGTSIAFTIGVTEVMGRMNVEVSNTYRYFECYAAVALIYWALVAGLTAVQRRWERHLEKADVLTGVPRC